jgi:hypothetical protein
VGKFTSGVGRRGVVPSPSACFACSGQALPGLDSSFCCLPRTSSGANMCRRFAAEVRSWVRFIFIGHNFVLPSRRTRIRLEGPKPKVKGSGQECPLHTSRIASLARRVIPRLAKRARRGAPGWSAKLPSLSTLLNVLRRNAFPAMIHTRRWII